MKKVFFTALTLSTFLITGLSVANANSNHGYTTAANVYSGSSSRGWYGGGVNYVLTQWRMERDVPEVEKAAAESIKATDTTSPLNEEQPETVDTPSAEAQPESVTSEVTNPKSPTPPTAPSIHE